MGMSDELIGHWYLNSSAHFSIFLGGGGEGMEVLTSHHMALLASNPQYYVR